MTLHADRYRIDWRNEHIAADPAGRTGDPRNFGWGGSYVFYTEGHEDGECERFAFKVGDGEWPVIQTTTEPGGK